MKNNKGFTLIELLVVMAIIALLAALVVPRLFNQGSSDNLRLKGMQIERNR